MRFFKMQTIQIYSSFQLRSIAVKTAAIVSGVKNLIENDEAQDSNRGPHRWNTRYLTIGSTDVLIIPISTR